VTTTVTLSGVDEETLENALDAIDADAELPDVDRGRGRSGDGEVSTGGRGPDRRGLHRVVCRGGWSR
jgi:hypothetical protein